MQIIGDQPPDAVAHKVHEALVPANLAPHQSNNIFRLWATHAGARGNGAPRYAGDAKRKETAKRHRPCSLAARGTPSSQLGSREGAERRETRGFARPPGGGEAARHACEARRLRGDGGCASRRSTAAFLSPAPCFRARLAERSSRPLAGQLPPPLASRLVQPFKAAPRSWGGRLPEASRRRGYEPRPQAPHPPRPRLRLMRTPSVWGG